MSLVDFTDIKDNNIEQKDIYELKKEKWRIYQRQYQKSNKQKEYNRLYQKELRKRKKIELETLKNELNQLKNKCV